MKNPLNNSGKIFRWYIWVPYSAAFVCTNTEQQYHQCETNTIDTWTQIKSISRYSDHGVRGTIDLSIFLGDQEPQPPVKSGHSSICDNPKNIEIQNFEPQKNGPSLRLSEYPPWTTPWGGEIKILHWEFLNQIITNLMTNPRDFRHLINVFTQGRGIKPQFVWFVLIV